MIKGVRRHCTGMEIQRHCVVGWSRMIPSVLSRRSGDLYSLAQYYRLIPLKDRQPPEC